MIGLNTNNHYILYDAKKQRLTNCTIKDAMKNKERIVERIGPSKDVIGREYLGPVADGEGYFKLIASRHSVRRYREDAISAEVLRKVLEAACEAPSAGNLQAFRVVVVVDRDKRARLAEAAFELEYLSHAPVLLVFCSYPAISAEKFGIRGQNLYAIQDATIAASYAQLAAVALGLGSAWVGAFEEDVVAEIIGDEGHDLHPVCIVPIGYAAEVPEQRNKRSVGELVYSEKVRLIA